MTHHTRVATKASAAAQMDAPGTPAFIETRDHATIERWARRHRAEPATGVAPVSEPGAAMMVDAGVGIRFNVPGQGRFRAVGWAEWFAEFDAQGLTFSYEDEDAGAREGSSAALYRIRVLD